MSNLFPAARLFQKLMIALDPSAKCVAIAGALAGKGNAKTILKTDFAATPAKYPGYTATSFAEMLDQVNMFQIIGTTGQAAYKFNSSATSSAIVAPTEVQGGVYLYGQENFNTLHFTAGTITHLALFIRPTP
jgi:hypothetical protein